MAFKQAERTNLYLRCALFGPSGSGKTMTALRMAKGIADKLDGRFAVIDTESRSASKYADRISFDVDDLTDKDIDSYITAMDECVKAGYKVLVIDSLSHAWRELTEEVDRISQSYSNKNSFSAWGKVSPKQKRLIDAILNFPGHIIATMRSKTEWVVSQNKNGKLIPEKMGMAPEQGKGIEYEFDLLVELNQKHVATVTKDRTGKFQDATIEKPGENFGLELFNWLTSSPTIMKEPIKEEVQETQMKDKEIFHRDFRKEGQEIIQQIGNIVTLEDNGVARFSPQEKDSIREAIKATKLDENGIKELDALLRIIRGTNASKQGQAVA